MKELLNRSDKFLFDLIPHPTLIIIDKIIVYANILVESVFGWSREELIGSSVNILLPPGKEIEYEDFICSEIREKKFCYLELALKNKSGKEIYCRLNISSIDTIPAQKGFIVTVEDITDKKIQEELLRKLENSIELSDIIVFIWTPDVEGNVKFVTNNISKFGYEREEFLSKRFSYQQIIYPEDLHTIYLPKLEECKRLGKDQCILEYRIVTKDGAIRWVEERTYIVRDETGNIKEYYGILIDITERKEMEEKLRVSESRYRLLFEKAPIGIRLIDKDRKTIISNPAWQKMIGYTEEELERMNSSTFTHPKDIEEDLELFDKLVKGGVNSYHKDERFIRKNGSVFWGALTASRITDENGNFLYELDTVEDITERKKSEEERRLCYERIEELFNNIILVLSKTIELKDPYIAGHQRKVMLLATKIAEAMDLDKDKIEGIRVASYLHDIGKITIPFEILNKPGKLSDLEFAIVKTHPTAGFEILKDVSFTWPVAEIVFQHHERLNGSGYLRGLKNGEILLEAKIIAVADVIEAMTSHRPYRPPMSLEVALDEIKKNKGILYDPEVVDVTVKLFEEGFSF